MSDSCLYQPQALRSRMLTTKTVGSYTENKLKRQMKNYVKNICFQVLCSQDV